MIDSSSKLVRECQTLALSKRDSRYEELYEQLKDLVFRVCQRTTGNTADAHDAMQDTFVLVFRRLDDFRFEAKFSSWVTRIAINCCNDRFRRNGRDASMLGLIEDGADYLRDVTDEGNELPDRTAERCERAEYVRASVSQLSPKFREVISLRYGQGLSYHELSVELDVSLGTVKSRLARAHQALALVLKWLRPQLASENILPQAI